ncbi:hypothetical protein JMJ77_0001650, partial [Colletotrichum scovillei]
PYSAVLVPIRDFVQIVGFGTVACRLGTPYDGVSLDAFRQAQPAPKSRNTGIGSRKNIDKSMITRARKREVAGRAVLIPPPSACWVTCESSLRYLARASCTRVCNTGTDGPISRETESSYVGQAQLRT